MRGKDQIKDAKKLADGITPAYAGKSVVGALSACVVVDHPRVCGEKTKKIP